MRPEVWLALLARDYEDDGGSAPNSNFGKSA